MGSCHRNPSTCKVMSSWSWAQGGCAVDPASLLLAVALLPLVVGPCLNAHKRHVRDPLYLFSSLLGRLFSTFSGSGVATLLRPG